MSVRRAVRSLVNYYIGLQTQWCLWQVRTRSKLGTRGVGFKLAGFGL